MPIQITVPSVGESVAEAAIAEWTVAEGEWVSEDETVAVLETDKANMDLPAPVSGRLVSIRKKAGDTVEVGEVIGEIAPGAPGDTPTEVVARQQAQPEEKPGEARVNPAARRLLAEKGIPPEQVEGTGRGGRVTKEDVLRHTGVETASPDSKGKGEGRSRRDEDAVRMTPLRKKVAARLLEAQQNQALLTTFNEIDMSAVMELRSRHKEAFQERYSVKLGFMSFFVKACIEALKARPEVNAEIRDDSIVYRNYYDVAVAVGTKRGLVTPVIRDAERLSFAEVEQSIADLAERARAGKLRLEELEGGTFTISNGGIYGSLLSTPIINPPQSGILGMHKIQERPVALAGQVVVRPMMYVALTYDHRVVDGEGAVSFLVRVKDCLEEPTRILLEV